MLKWKLPGNLRHRSLIGESPCRYNYSSSTHPFHSLLYFFDALDIVIELCGGWAFPCSALKGHRGVVCDHFGEDVKDGLGDVSLQIW